MLTSSLLPYQLLLETFRLGLIKGFVSRAGVIAWADDIIINTDEPDYFLIEISVSKDVNGLIEIINNSVNSSDSMIPARVLLGLVYDGFVNDKLSTADTIKFIANIASYDLTWHEYGDACDFEDYEMFYHSIEQPQHKENLLKFLSVYQKFNLSNYSQWGEINKEIDDAFDNEEKLAIAIHNTGRQEQQKLEAGRKKKRTILAVSLIVFIAVVLFANIYTLFKTGKIPDYHYYTNFIGAFIIFNKNNFENALVK